MRGTKFEWFRMLSSLADVPCVFWEQTAWKDWEGQKSWEAIYFCLFFFAAGFFLGVPGSMLSCFSDFLLLCLHCFSAFPASLLFCFSTFLLFAFPASLLFLFLCFSAFCFSCFLVFLFLCFSASLFSLLLCFCTSVPFYFYYSTFSFLQSCVFAALLPAPLLLCFLSLLSLCFSFSFALFCSVCILNETLKRP